jgi:hypothetical protein
MTVDQRGRVGGQCSEEPPAGLSVFRGLMVSITAVLLITAGSANMARAQEQIVPLQIDEVVFDDVLGQFVAIGSLGDEPFQLPIDLELALRNVFGDFQPTCPILDLQLGPIDLDLLGLQVETSRIHLEIWAEPGEGQLLGNLLCAVAHLLDGGLTLDEIIDSILAGDLANLFPGLDLGGLTPEQQVTALLEGLRDLLDGILQRMTTPTAADGDTMTATRTHPGRGPPPHAGQPGRPPHAGQPGGPNNGAPPAGDGAGTTILRLVVGPVFLELLGLNVYLHDCDDGPVWVEVRAVPGEGRLLGNLLSQLVRLFDRDPLSARLEDLIDRILDEIDNLLALQ